VSLYLYGVLDQHDAFMVRDEFRRNIRKCRLPAGSCPTDEDVLAIGNILDQLISKSRRQRACFNDVAHLEFAGVELTNGQSNAVDAAGGKDGGNATAIGQPGVQDWL
jgi:hypothetical protein